MKPHYGKGFTIVELLIVIVVIGILAAISIVAYNGIQDKAQSTRAASVVDGVAKALAMYKAEAGHYPVRAGAITVCIGEASNYPSTNDFAAGECDNTQGVATDETFNVELRRYISIPNGSLPATLYAGQGARGVVYVSDSTGSYGQLAYVVRGDQSCPRGIKIEQPGMTGCQIILE